MTPLSRRAFLGQSALALTAAAGRAAEPEAGAVAVNHRLGRGINFGNVIPFQNNTLMDVNLLLTTGIRY